MCGTRPSYFPGYRWLFCPSKLYLHVALYNITKYKVLRTKHGCSCLVSVCVCVHLFYFHFSVVVFLFFLLYYISFSWYCSQWRKGNRPLPYRIWQGRWARLHVMCGRASKGWGWEVEGAVVVWGKKDDVLGKGTRPNVKNGTRKLNLNSWKKRSKEDIR